jgi:hypothetical protein
MNFSLMPLVELRIFFTYKELNFKTSDDQALRTIRSSDTILLFSILYLVN